MCFVSFFRACPTAKEKIMPNATSVSLDDNVADTLFIPLLMRSRETRRPRGIIHDVESCRLVDCIDYDFSKYGKSNSSQVGTAIRIRCFDDAVSRFVEEHANPVVIQIGAGLDTRFHRVFKGKGTFYELDLPEVIALRRQLIPESEHNLYIAGSLFDTAWMEEIVQAHPEASFVLVAEGVFMFFASEQLKPFFEEVAARFPRGELHFDITSSWAVRKGSKHETFSKSRATFKWGLDDDCLLETWSPHLRHLGTTTYMDKERLRWPVLSMMATLLPSLRKGFRMLHYGIEPKA